MSLPVGESRMVSCHGGWEFLTVYHDMPNKSCLVIISSSKLDPLLVFDTATSQDKTLLVFDTASISYVSLQDLACISTYHLSAFSLSNFFSFLIYRSASPLATQFIKISELSLIAHRHRQQPAACIWYSNSPRHHFYLIQWAWFIYFLLYSPLTTPIFLDLWALFHCPPTSWNRSIVSSKTQMHDWHRDPSIISVFFHLSSLILSISLKFTPVRHMNVMYSQSGRWLIGGSDLGFCL